MSDPALLDYYSRRAAEYERIYSKPERHADLARLREHLRALLTNRRVLEVACGTGYWTSAMADATASITATDASEEVLEVARSKRMGDRVTFRRADAWKTGELSGDFDAGLAAFWWSHVPKQKLAAFLAGFHAALKPGARVVFSDNRFVAGSSTPLSRTDESGNSYQSRRLDDGSTHEVLKNFPTRAELLELAAPHGGINVAEWQYFWCLSYELSPSSTRSSL
jgi:2-polyprenyl-3-methyl-5-hydroxy-6-metoxy-1,4-benzoquinol methylase